MKKERKAYKYIGEVPVIWEGKELKTGDVIESDLDLHPAQFREVKLNKNKK